MLPRLLNGRRPFSSGAGSVPVIWRVAPPSRVELVDRIEQESFDFFNRTRARYLELAAQDKSIHTIDATQPLEAVMDAIRTTVTHWVKELDA